MNNITPFIVLIVSSALTFFGAMFLGRNAKEALIMMIKKVSE